MFWGAGMADAANAHSDPVVNLGVGATISNSCATNPITMGAITGTGQSTITAGNSTACTVITNNSAGYKLEWAASAATMSNGSDTIAAYTPAGAVPETWSVDAAASEWGGHLGASSTTADTTTWGAADTYAGGKWFNVATGTAYEIIHRHNQTSSSGDSEVVFFGAEVGASKFQPAGTYTVTVVMTATAL